MVLKKLDCLFCRIPSMVVWWDELVLHLVALDSSLEVYRSLVVEDVHFWLQFLVL